MLADATRSETAGSGSISTSINPKASSASAGAVRQHDGDRLADIAHLVFGNDGLGYRLELRQRLQPHGNARHRMADILRRDDAVHPGKRARPRDIDRADAAVGHGAAQDGGMQKPLAREVIDIFPTPTQEAQVLEAFNRAADEGVDRPHGEALVAAPSLAASFLYAARASSTASTMEI